MESHSAANEQQSALKAAADETLKAFGHAVEEHEVELYLGTCQNCGAYWDVRQYRECPARYGAERTVCGGYIG